MELNQAQDIIVQAINAATLKGVYSINDMINIIAALQKLKNVQDIEFVGDPKPIENE
jgi:hypothetical protein